MTFSQQRANRVKLCGAFGRKIPQNQHDSFRHRVGNLADVLIFNQQGNQLHDAETIHRNHAVVLLVALFKQQIPLPRFVVRDNVRHRRAVHLASRQIRAAEVGFLQARMAQIGVAQIGVGEIRAAEIRPAQIRAAQIRMTDIRAGQNRRAHIRPAHRGVAHVRAAEIRPARVGFVQQRVGEVGFAEIGL